MESAAGGVEGALVFFRAVVNEGATVLVDRVAEMVLRSLLSQRGVVIEVADETSEDAIGVDEIQYAKGHKYLTLVYQIDAGFTRLLWVGKERTIASFEGFFTAIGTQLAAQIEFVCSDMWQNYLDVIRDKCPQALHILDRFHIVAHRNKALDEIRAGEARKLVQEGNAPLLKKTRWCVLKRKENLTAKQQHRLRDLLRYNLQTVRAYLLKEDFQQFWKYNSPYWAGMFLDFWCSQTMRSRIEPLLTL